MSKSLRPTILSVLGLALLLVVIRPGNAYALSRGDTITTDTAITADLGLCPGLALTVGASNIVVFGFVLVAATAVYREAGRKPECAECRTSPRFLGRRFGVDSTADYEGPGQQE